MKKIQGIVKALNDQTVTVVASSDTKDRDGEVLNPQGWVLDNFKNNPVLLWSHRAEQLPIGKVIDIKTEGNQLVADVVFAEHDFAQEVEKLVRSGMINTTSVGFMPIESDAKGNMSKQELLELSFVNVPSNPSALVSREYKDFQAKVKAFENKAEVKEGRVISEKNRNIMRIAKESMLGSIEAIDEVLTLSEPKPKQENTPDKKGVVIKTKPQGKQVNKTLRLAKLMDKIAEALIHNEKERR